jgi:hypothetical protein
LEEEILVANLNTSTERRGPLPFVFTALNGSGSVSANKFPGDEIAQIEDFKNTITVVGTSRANYIKGAYPVKQGIAMQFKGVQGMVTPVDVPFGSMLEATPPLPSEAQNLSRIARQGTQPDKVRMYLRPIQFKTTGEEYMANMTRYLISNRYADSIRNGTNTNPAHIYLLNKNIEQLMNLLNGLDILLRSNVIDITWKNPTFKLDRPGTASNNTEKLLGLAQAFGVLGKEPFHIDNISIDPIKQKKYDELRLNLLKAMNYNPEAMPANLGFGFNTNGDNTNPGVNPSTGVIRTSTAHGKMLDLQINSHKYGLASWTEFLNNKWRFYMGKAILGAEAGGYINYVR